MMKLMNACRQPAHLKGRMIMQAIVYTKYGTPDVLKLEEVKTPSQGKIKSW